MDRDAFVNAIAPKHDLTRIDKDSYATLFRVADSSKRGLVSWDDFMLFETLLKRPDADYWIAFQYFDVFVIAIVPAAGVVSARTNRRVRRHTEGPR